MSYGVVQVRGTIDTDPEIRDTLEMLNLGSVNNFTLVPKTDSYQGMVVKVNDYVAYGEPSASTLTTLLRKRAETLGGGELNDEYVDENTKYDSVEELAEALVEGETTLREVSLKPTIRLHPPRKGHSGVKHSRKEGGVLGDHGEELDELLERMR